MASSVTVTRCAAGNIEDFSVDRSRVAGGKKIGVNDVVDVGEIARLLAVAVDHRVFAGNQRLGEGRDDGSVGVVRALPGTENVEVSQRGGVKPVAAAVRLAQGLARHLVGGIRTARLRRTALGLGQCRRVAVGAAAGGEHHTTDAGQSGRFQHVERAGRVDLVIVPRLLDTAGHGAQRRLVKYESAVAGAVSQRISDQDRLLNESDPPKVLGRPQVFTHPTGKVIQDRDRGTQPAQCRGEV